MTETQRAGRKDPVNEGETCRRSHGVNGGRKRDRRHLLCRYFIYRYKSRAVITLKQTLLGPYTRIHLCRDAHTHTGKVCVCVCVVVSRIINRLVDRHCER